MPNEPLGYDELLIGIGLNQGPIHDYLEEGGLSAANFEAFVPRLIWRTFQKFYQKRGGVPDAEVLSDLFTGHDKKKQVAAYARRAAKAAKDLEVTQIKLDHYVEQLCVLHEDAEFKRNIKQAIDIIKKEGSAAAKEFLSTSLTEETPALNNTKTIDLIESFEEIKKDVLHKREHPEDNPAIPLGIRPFDHILSGGLLPEELMLIAGIPSSGKSIGLQDISVSTAEVGNKAHLFTIEMSASQTGFRDYTRLSGVPTHKFRNPQTITDADVEQWERSVQRLKSIPGAGLKITSIPEHASTRFMRAELSRIKRKTGWDPDIILVDYAGIMRPSDGNRYAHDSDWAFIGQNVLDLKNWAKASKKPIVSAVQLHPNAEGEDVLTYKHLGLSKILISAHADIILGIIPVDREEAEVIDIIRWQWLKLREGAGAVDEYGRRTSFIDLRPDFSQIRIHKEA